jgi:general secretion pathway protein H
VVLLIIGIVLSFAVLSIGNAPSRETAGDEMRRLAALVDLAREEAILQATEVAMEVRTDGYSFLHLEGEHWLPVGEDDPVLRPRELAAGTHLELSLEGESLDLDRGKDESAPRVFLLSSGELSPFRLRVIDEVQRQAYTLTGAADGRLLAAGPDRL